MSLRLIRPLNSFQPTLLFRQNVSTFKQIKTQPFSTIGKYRQTQTSSIWKSKTTTTFSSTTKITTIAAATTTTFTFGLWKSKPILCQAATAYTPTSAPFDTGIDDQIKRDAGAKKTLFHKGELSFGILLGFCTGYLIKKVGKLFALMIGVGFVFLQYLSFNGFITIHWDRMEGNYNKQLGAGSDGKVTRQHVSKKWNAFVGFLTHNLQFKSTFMVGLYGGIRYG
ncbi:unnamed protein product [Cunninghamella blakesleeana]